MNLVNTTGRIDQVEQIQPRDFLHNYIRKNRPLLMTGMTTSWPALSKWSLEFFRSLGSDRAVHLEEGNVMQEETSFRKQGFLEFIDELLKDAGPATDAGAAANGRKRGYLSLFKIFDEFPELRGDVDFSLLNQFKLKSTTAGWIGPAGTVTGYHVDWGDNLLAQVRGRKLLHLAAPDNTPNMYVSRKFDQGTTISEVDLDHYDSGRFPLFANVVHRVVTLQPGQMLFIPRGWWHHVRSLDASISVSNIGYSLKGICCDAIPQRAKQILHNLGIWRCICTCHVWRDGKWVRK